MDPRPESIDLARLIHQAQRMLRGRGLRGYVPGRTAIRCAVARCIGASDVLAENLVETMIGRGFLRYSGNPRNAGDDGVWEIMDAPERGAFKDRGTRSSS